jgi:4,5-DOPA dioxygenase extradiol
MKLPVLFQAHGAPMLLDDAGWVAELAAWAKALPRPKSILVVSAHWEARPLSIGATRPLPLIYDFYGFPDKFYKLQYYGFPDKFYKLQYPSPGAPDLAARVRQLLSADRIAHTDEADRGLDHGTYIPLMCMYPEADLPVLQVSMPSMNPADLFAMGKALAPLRDEGVLLIGSGFITHNLRALPLRETPAWAKDFDAWTADVLARRDHDALLDYRARAPGVRESLPTHEHFVPLIFSAGAARDTPLTFPITGFWWDGAMTRRSVQFG